MSKFIYDYDDTKDSAVAINQETNERIYFEEDIEVICPECGCDCCSLGDPSDDIEAEVVSYDAYCDNCGEAFYAEGTLNITDKEVM